MAQKEQIKGLADAGLVDACNGRDETAKIMQMYYIKITSYSYTQAVVYLPTMKGFKKK